MEDRKTERREGGRECVCERETKRERERERERVKEKQGECVRRKERQIKRG